MQTYQLFSATYDSPQPIRGAAPYGNVNVGMGADEASDVYPMTSAKAGTPSMGTLKNIVSTPFLNEPFWRWVVFIIALGFVLGAWRGVIGYMK
jgi:hypothetical protein